MTTLHATSRVAPEPWLEVVETASPILLIAPHGGQAGESLRVVLHPKVNDLHTADMTRELSTRLDASALINHGMDRNLLDCNRLPQLVERAPWLLELIAEQLTRIVARHGHATVLLIHGWNIIEPRVDFGLGVRRVGTELRPVGSAHVAAGDHFINGPLHALAARLQAAGIAPSFGMRYPGGGIHNLVQLFTARHRESATAAVRRIAETCSAGLVDAAQFEISVAARMPGPQRERLLDSMVEVFKESAAIPTDAGSHHRVIRTPSRPKAPTTPKTPVMPARVGIEFFDPKTRIGAMASFDLGTPGFGGRIMMLLGPRRAALFTGEGRVTREPHRIRLGPLALSLDGDALSLTFDGPAVLVPDSSAYLSIERALASARLDPALKVELRMRLPESDFDPAQIFDSTIPQASGTTSGFGELSGEITHDRTRYAIDAVARAGLSFTGLGPQRFRARRMIWARFADGSAPSAIELRATTTEDSPEQRSARLLHSLRWSEAELAHIELDTPALDAPPDRIAARIGGSAPGALLGEVSAFVPLSRPGPDGSRIYTSLGFANFSLDGTKGAGMFEFSRRGDAVTNRQIGAEDEDDDTE